MPFGQTTKYAMRAMAWLAHHGRDQPRTGIEVASHTGVPEAYVSKILGRLVQAGLLESQKGRGGGFRLAREPASITFAEILAAVDASPEVGVCVFGYGRCSDSDPCALHGVWARYVQHTAKWARTTTLAQVGDPAEHDR